VTVTPAEVVTDAAPVYPAVLDELTRRPGTTSNAMRTTGSKPTTAVSNSGCDRCVGYAPTAPLESSSPGSLSCRTCARGHYEPATETPRQSRMAAAAI